MQTAHGSPKFPLDIHLDVSFQSPSHREGFALLLFLTFVRGGGGGETLTPTPQQAWEKEKPSEDKEKILKRIAGIINKWKHFPPSGTDALRTNSRRDAPNPTSTDPKWNPFIAG